MSPRNCAEALSGVAANSAVNGVHQMRTAKSNNEISETYICESFDVQIKESGLLYFNPLAFE